MKIHLLLPIVLLAACGKPPEDTVGKEIADDYNKAMDEAAAVQEQVDASKARVDEALDEADGGTSD